MDGFMGRNYNRSIFKHLEETLAKFDALEREFNTYKQKSEQELFECRAKIADLEAAIIQKDEQIALLRADNERLKRTLNNNSGNSSLPPSSDQKPSKPANAYNGRTKTGRHVGGQEGHLGRTLTQKDIEALIRSKKCTHVVSELGNLDTPFVKRFILDTKLMTVVHEVRIHADSDGKFRIPPELKSTVIYGNGVKTLGLAISQLGDVPIKRTCDLISDLSDGLIRLSPGSLYHFEESFAEAASDELEAIKDSLMNSEVLCTDSTHVVVGGCQEHIRNQSTSEAVLYSSLKTKTIEEMKTLEVLANHAGILVHDHETALYHFGIDHAECNAHILRYLRKNSEETGNLWSEDFANLLNTMNVLKQELEGSHSTPFHADLMSLFNAEYDVILNEAIEQNKSTKGKLAKAEEYTLINRLRRHKDNHLLFATRADVPFTNNMSERDLRKCKNRQKSSGGFRTAKGKEIYCKILSIIETCRRKGKSFIEQIQKILNPIPALAMM